MEIGPADERGLAEKDPSLGTERRRGAFSVGRVREASIAEGMRPASADVACEARGGRVARRACEPPPPSPASADVSL